LSACRNTALTARLSKKRHALLKATERVLESSRKTIPQGKLRGEEKIRARVNKRIEQALRHGFTFVITDEHFHFECVDKQSASDDIDAQLGKKLEKIGTRV